MQIIFKLKLLHNLNGDGLLQKEFVKSHINMFTSSKFEAAVCFIGICDAANFNWDFYFQSLCYQK